MEFKDPFDEILQLAVEEPTKRYHFYKAFLELELVVIGKVASDPKEELTLDLKYIEIEGELILPVYSCWEKFHSILGSDFTYVKIPTQMLLDAIEVDKPWVLNPGFDLSKKIIPEELETLRDGRIVHHFFENLSDTEKKQLMTEQTTAVSDTTLDAISSYLQDYPSIKKAYITHIYNPSTNEQAYPLIGLEIDESDRQQAMELIHSISKKVNQHVPFQPLFEWMVLDESLPLATSMVEQTEPFYERDPLDSLRSMFH
ncbi:enhanced serine sensitivity protein SseB [Radiobacillus kanasensis]|uniref:enhanced serine sensitivity protein SseB C-terminal domain-containing protein n=1 Tax=Radiobacillus kanasensis TaxID=2844358 RepID=UPI001E4081D8|nr:enhanced serine sensitivity protein SseB C-terminal domain-containing protein [Radiobacillus kanasensis]UFT99605.1 enhanced serine sensitivity protein SseB [Radiobacillus kanasensis]